MRAVLAWLALLRAVTAGAAEKDTTTIETWIDHPAAVSHETDVYARPSNSSAAIGRLRGGVQVVVIGAVAGHAWLQIKLPDGKTVGYVPVDAVPTVTGNPADIANAPEADAAANALVTGHPIVRDTATLVVGRREVHLFGVQGESGEMADGLQRFISAKGGTVTCAPQGEARYVCLLPDNTDVAMVALLNGAARMTADAPGLYRDQQAEAQRNKKGVWAPD